MFSDDRLQRLDVTASENVPANRYEPVYDELLRMYPCPEPLKFKEKFRRVVLTADAWLLHIVRGCEAVLLLEDEGFRGQTAPLRRSIIEHLVALKWLEQDGADVIDPYQISMHARLLRFQEATELAGWEPLDKVKLAEIARIEAQASKKKNNLMPFAHQARYVEAYDDLAGYYHETAFCHPSIESAAIYFEGGPERDIDQVGFCAIHLYEAIKVVSALFEPHPWFDRLPDIRARITEIGRAIRIERGMPNVVEPAGWDSVLL